MVEMSHEGPDILEEDTNLEKKVGSYHISDQLRSQLLTSAQTEGHPGMYGLVQAAVMERLVRERGFGEIKYATQQIMGRKGETLAIKFESLWNDAKNIEAGEVFVGDDQDAQAKFLDKFYNILVELIPHQ